MYGKELTPGMPGSRPLPVPGNPGTAWQMQQKMHPAAGAAYNRPARQNPLNQQANAALTPTSGPPGPAHR